MKKLVLLIFLSFVLISCESGEKSIDSISEVNKTKSSLEQQKQPTWVWWIENEQAESFKNEIEIKIIEKSEWEKLLNKNLKAPDLIWLSNWINGEEIKSLEELKWKVVFIDFWTYTCINCIRTLDHMQELHEKYADEWLVILWIHAPEFAYERKIENVKKAVEKYGLTYSVVQDNDFATWKNYKNRYWPAQYIINKQWIIKYVHFGEGAYEKMDSVVEFLLSE